MDEFYDISQSSEDLNIDFNPNDFQTDLFDIKEILRDEYPVILVSGVKFNDTLKILKECCRESYRSFNVFVDLDDGNPPVKVGQLPVDINTILTMRYLGLSVVLFLAEDTVMNLDLNNPTELESFV